jgi:hypothetical protein
MSAIYFDFLTFSSFSMTGKDDDDQQARIDDLIIVSDSIDTSTSKRKQDSDLNKSKRKKVALTDCLLKWINLIRQKDVYGFFLSPVDLKYVPDYTLIVKNPMDLGTMREKVKKKKYTCTEEFQVNND